MIDLSVFNFSEKEAKVYTSCLQLKQASAGTIARHCNENRVNVYGIIKSLQKRGILHETINNKKIKEYHPISPDMLVKNIEKKLGIAQKLLPQLNEIGKILGKKFNLKSYQGESGFMESFNQILKSCKNQEIHAFWFPLANRSKNTIREFIKNEFIPQRIENKIHANVITNNKNTENEFIKSSKKQKRKTYILESDFFQTSIRITLYNNTTVFTLFNEPIDTIVIENESVYNSLLGIFKTLKYHGKEV